MTQGEHDVTIAINKDLRERLESGWAPTDVYVAVGGSGTINEVIEATSVVCSYFSIENLRLSF